MTNGVYYFANVANVVLDDGTYTSLTSDPGTGAFLHSVADDLDLDVSDVEIDCLGSAFVSQEAQIET